MSATFFTFSMICLALSGLLWDLGFRATTLTLCVCSLMMLVVAGVLSEPRGLRR